MSTLKRRTRLGGDVATVPGAPAPAARPSADPMLAWCRQAFDLSPLGIAFVSPDRRSLAVNPALCRILGRSRAELEGAGVAALTHPEDVDLHVEPHRRLLAGEIDRYTIEKRYLDPAGGSIWVRLHVAAVRDGAGGLEMLISQCEDISEVRRAAEALALEQARFAALVERSSDLMVVVGPTAVVRYASPAARRTWGYEPAELVGRHVGDFVHADDLDAVIGAVSATAAERGRSVTVTCRVRHADGSVRHVEATTGNWLDEPGIEGMVLNVRDVTERVEAIDALRWQADHDGLTGLANRHLLHQRAERALGGDRTDGEPSLLFVDLDGFKSVNDRYGHDIGDEVLLEVAKRLRRTIRRTDVAARFGGDEFVVLVDPPAASADVRALADRILEVVSLPYATATGILRQPVTASIGIAFADHVDVERLVLEADRALYAAKRGGRARVEVFHAGFRSRR